MVHSFLAGLSDALASGSWSILPLIFAFSFIASFNPCMFSMVPLIVSGTKQNGFGKVVLFSGGFTLMLMVLGVLSAVLGFTISIPGVIWSIVLGLLYLLVGLVLLRVKLPIYVSGFWVRRTRSRSSLKDLNFNPFVLGSLFALSPSPCTLPAVLAIMGYTMATGKLLFGALALGTFAVGHSLFLALTFLPSVRRKISSYSLTNLKPVIGVTLILLAIYLLTARPEFISHMPTNK